MIEPVRPIAIDDIAVFGLAMGNVDAYSPLMAAWGPFALFPLIGETVLIRSEE